MAVLVEQHGRFLDFLVRRLGDRSAAEDVLQDAFVRGLERVGQLRDGEAVTAWFYRVLRNAAVDHLRRRGAARQALERLASELPEAGPDPEAEGEICRCVVALAGTLKPEYAQAVRRVELEGRPLRELAEEAGITPNNAAVRLHRARAALRERVAASCRTCAVHGCLDCTCESGSGGEV